ncbi:hypothetical protein y223_00032 [Bordetella phage PY223]
MKNGLITVADFRNAIAEVAGRGRLTVNDYQRVEIRVPLWLVTRVEAIMRSRAYLTMQYNVRALSFIEHFTLWRVKVRSK